MLYSSVRDHLTIHLWLHHHLWRHFKQGLASETGMFLGFVASIALVPNTQILAPTSR